MSTTAAAVFSIMNFRPCFVCGSPGVCRHREAELRTLAGEIEPQAIETPQSATPRAPRYFGRFPHRRQQLGPEAITYNIGPVDNPNPVRKTHEKGQVHWADIIIAWGHAKKAAEESGQPCLCESCHRVRVAIQERGIRKEAVRG